MGNRIDSIKTKLEKHEPFSDAIQAAEHTGQMMLNEVQNDWNQSCKWVKQHPCETTAIAGGALIFGGIALSLKDERDGARAIVEGNKILEGEQVAAEKILFQKAGGDKFVTTRIKFGDSSEEQFWVDSNSPQGRKMIDQSSGLGGAFKN